VKSNILTKRRGWGEEMVERARGRGSGSDGAGRARNGRAGCKLSASRRGRVRSGISAFIGAPTPPLLRQSSTANNACHMATTRRASLPHKRNAPHPLEFLLHPARARTLHKSHTRNHLPFTFSYIFFNDDCHPVPFLIISD